MAGGFQLDGAISSENTITIDNRPAGSEFTILDDEFSAEFPIGGNPDVVRQEGLQLAISRLKLMSGLSVGRSRAERLTNEKLQGRIAAAAEPTYSQDAANAKALGLVAVEIETDINGIVQKAKAVSGHETLRPLAEQAAMLTRFYPTLNLGIKMRISGKLLYDFESAEGASVYVRKMRTLPLSQSDIVEARRLTKLHHWLYRLIEKRTADDATVSFNESTFVDDGKARVTVVYAKRSQGAIKRLENAGLTVISEKGNSVVGTIDVGKLAALADIAEVELVIPRL